MTEALPLGDWPDRDKMATAREALDTKHTATAFAADLDEGSKRRAACDECRMFDLDVKKQPADVQQDNGNSNAQAIWAAAFVVQRRI
jgi:hypothetical protein